MTDNEIIKSMQCVIGNDVNCSECTYQKKLPFPSCRRMCAKNALDLINRQKAEIERLEDEIDKQYEQAKADILANIPDGGTSCHWCIDNIKSESVREFAKELKNCFAISGDYLDIINIIDNLVKEMTE